MVVGDWIYYSAWNFAGGEQYFIKTSGSERFLVDSVEEEIPLD